MGTATDRVRAEYDKKLAEAKIEDALRERLPRLNEYGPLALLEPRVHVYPLYGRVATVTYGDWSSYHDRSKPTWDHAVELVEKLPPEPLTQVRDGSLSFRPRSVVRALPEADKARWQSETDISPILVHVDGHQGVRLQLEWTSRVAEQLVDVRAEMGFPPAGIGSYGVERRELKGRTEYGLVTWRSPGEMTTVHAECDPLDGDPLAQLEAPVRWASGSAEYPGRITLYFVDIGVDLAPARVGAAIVRHLRDRARAGQPEGGAR